MDLYIRFIFGIISTYAIVVLNYAIFKIEIKGNDKQIAIIAVVVGVTNVYCKFVADSNFFVIVQTIVYIVLVTIFRRYPLLYSTIVCIIGSFAATMVDASVTLTALGLKLTTVQDTINNPTHYIVLHLVVTILDLLIAFVLVRYRIGFTFVIRRFIGKYSLRPSSFIWAILLIVGTLILQFNGTRYNIFSLNGCMMTTVALVLIASIIYAYYQNKKSVTSRFSKEKDGV